MLTQDAPKNLEFNCRFGDPETQVLMPLLETDLVDILLASTEGRLNELSINWHKASAVTVVLASGGYPESYEIDKLISGLDKSSTGVKVFHAGTKLKNEQILSSGGRVLNVTALEDTLERAVHNAYQHIPHLSFDKLHYRHDIAAKAFKKSAYERSGVSIDRGNLAVKLMKDAVTSTHHDKVLAGVGAFGGLFALEDLPQQPVLVASTDGVGTKVKLACELGSYRSLGHDIVNHCLNDIACSGGGLKPLFFLDYVASSKLNAEVVAEIVIGMTGACKAAGCALLGGETAEMPGVYAEGSLDIVGTIVGLIDKGQIYPKASLKAGDKLLALPSDSPHTSGYSLIRQIIREAKLDLAQDLAGQTLAAALLKPHRSYLAELGLLEQASINIQALAHITGGGIVENLPRIFPDGLTAVIKKDSWQIPPLYQLLQEKGQVSEQEMYRVFNMGVGIIIVIPQEQLAKAQSLLPESFCIGEVISGNGLLWR
ncbi:MAG: phosphoribosylformylglycinamidine cyclo-ligase [Deinococcales bacterium]